ncbi:hypothetical protein IAU60_004609 [Kwoniella sp. DSM 27419]
MKLTLGSISIAILLLLNRAYAAVHLAMSRHDVSRGAESDPIQLRAIKLPIHAHTERGELRNDNTRRQLPSVSEATASTDNGSVSASVNTSATYPAYTTAATVTTEIETTGSIIADNATTSSSDGSSAIAFAQAGDRTAASTALGTSTSSTTSEATATPGATNTTDDSDDGRQTLPVESEHGIIYTLDVTVDGVTMPVHIDSASVQFWAAHSSCEACVTSGMTTINTSLPADCAAEGVQKRLTYAAGWVSGCMVNVSLALGSDTLTEYPILAVTDADSGTANNNGHPGTYRQVKLGSSLSRLRYSWVLADNVGVYSGRLGLEPDMSPTLDQGHGVVSTMYQRGIIHTPEVGFYLPHEGSSGGWEVTFGDPTSSQHIDSSKMVKLPKVGNTTHYTVQFDGAAINGLEAPGTGAMAIVDSGWSGLGMPNSWKKYVYEHVYVNPTDDPRGTIVPCTPINPATNITFTFQAQAFQVLYEDLIYGPDEGGQCRDLIAWLNDDVRDNANWGTPWVLGDGFLHNVYHAFNVNTAQVTFYGLRGE